MKQTAQTNLIVHPQAESYRNENRRLKTELAQLIAERDSLKHSVVPQIAAEYQIKIGVLEWRAFQMDCETRAMCRRIEMAQAMLNRGDEPCYGCIEQEIETEFAHWREKIRHRAREIKAARQLENLPALTRDESRELQTVYRRLAFLLHPDIAGANAGERLSKFWLQAAEAYRRADLPTLKTIRLLVETDAAENEFAAGGGNDAGILETLKNRRAELKRLCETLLNEITETKVSEPYVWREILDDPAEVERRQTELSEQIKILREKRSALASYWAEIMRFAKDREAVSIPVEPPDVFADEIEDDWAEIICDF